MTERLETSLLVAVVVGLGLYGLAALFVFLNSIVPIWILLVLMGLIFVVAFVIDTLTPGSIIGNEPPEDE